MRVMAMKYYWEKETPETVASEKNVLRYYRQAGRLQVGRPSWTDKDGKEKHGKTVTLDIEALEVLEPEKRAKARANFEEIMEALLSA